MKTSTKQLPEIPYQGIWHTVFKSHFAATHRLLLKTQHNHEQGTSKQCLAYTVGAMHSLLNRHPQMATLLAIEQV